MIYIAHRFIRTIFLTSSNSMNWCVMQCVSVPHDGAVSHRKRSTSGEAIRMIPRSFRLYDRDTLRRTLDMIAKLPVSEEHPLLLEVSDFKDRKTRSQEKLWHAILQDASANLVIDGRRFSVETLKEYYARKYFGTVELVMPDGEIITRRRSTAVANVEEYSALIDRTLQELAEHGYLSVAA